MRNWLSRIYGNIFGFVLMCVYFLMRRTSKGHKKKP